MDDRALRGDAWRKSSYSADQGACVEITQSPPLGMAVRDSTDAGGPRLLFTAAGWQAFTRKVKGDKVNSRL